MTAPLPIAPILPAIRDIALEAGRIALRYFRPGASTSARVWNKAGGSPVTEADVAVDTFLKIRLSALLPEAGWLSEETRDDPRRLGRELVWIVDPIDGTRAFLNGSHDWSVAIALLQQDKPRLGIVYAPAHDQFYEAVAGESATRNGRDIRVTAEAEIGSLPVSGPKPFVDRLEARHPGVTRADRIPSLALRLARVADGSIGAALVSSDARDWDIAAAHLILAEAGGALTGLDSRSPVYNREEPRHGELVGAPALLQERLIAVINGDAITHPGARP